MIALRRIAYVLKIFPKISETFIVNELAGLRRRGVDLRIFSLLPPREEIQHASIAAAGLNQFTCYDQHEFSSRTAEFRPQILHAHFATEAAAAARQLAGEHHLPFTFTSHGYDIYRKAPADYGARAEAAAAVVTVSRANATYISTQFGVPETKIRVISCGVDLDLFRPARNGSPGVPLIVCVARHVVVKNLGILLRSCARLSGKGIRFKCVLVGDGPCRRELEALSRELGLQELVELVGAAEHSEVPGYWKRATIGVLASTSEGMPVSLMEAAACGVPVVATSVGGVPELVQDGVTGLLVPSNDEQLMAASLERLLLDQGLCRKMGIAARKRAEQHFSLDRQLDKLIELWSEVLSGSTA